MKQQIIAFGALIHAALITAMWAAAMYGDVRVLSGPVWVLVAWAWLVWPAILITSHAYASRLATAAVAIGALVIVPTTPEIYTFTWWSFGEFAR
jgi:hypothetical protein